MAAQQGRAAGLQRVQLVVATLHCCSQCPRIFAHKASALYHTARTGHVVDTAPRVLLREVRPPDEAALPPHVRTMKSTVHSCSCDAHHSLVAFNAAAHAMRCGGVVAKRTGVMLCAEVPTPPPQPPQPQQPQQQPQQPPQQQQQQLQQQEPRGRRWDFAVAARAGERPAARSPDQQFENVVEDLAAPEVAETWLVLLEDDHVDDFDWAAVAAPFVWRTLRARVGDEGGVAEWTASDGRRIATRLADFKRQVLAVCHAACLEAAQRGNFSDKELVRRARVFADHMATPCTEFGGVNRTEAVRAWTRTPSAASSSSAPPRRSSSSSQQQQQQQQFAPLSVQARRWLTGTCMARMCAALNLAA